jgi:uncharacterized tellurite resistance protein B-like protein
MLSTLKELFETFTHAPGDSPAEREQALRLSTAVLLVEVMRADLQVNDVRQRVVAEKLRNRFGLDDHALGTLVTQAGQTARHAYDYQHFTSSLNDHWTQGQKISLLENMWDVAYADAHVDANENHVISKVAGLLHVTHGEYIGAKMRAKEAAGQL